MKKEIIITIFFINIILFLNKSYAYTEEFTIMLEAMEIPKENIAGKQINEEIYNEYQLLVYGSPLETHNAQRWKNTVDGKWTKNAGKWNGVGIRGEYWILGTNYNGKEVHNHLFPVDIEPPTEPTSWRYAVIPDALESWQETEKYMDDIQKDYMLTQNLMRNNVTYELKIMDIGLEKVRIENYATWKTKGTVYTQRYDMNNKKWAANFMVPAMAGDAKLEGYAEFPLGTEYQMDKDDDSINIPIIYGSDIINLTEYAKKEHVREIKSQLFIDGRYIEEISDKGKLSIEKETAYIFDKSKYKEDSIISLNIEIKSTLFTTFLTDGALVDISKYIIYINCGDSEVEKSDSYFNFVEDSEYKKYPDFPPPKITSIEISQIDDGRLKPLLISKKTGKEFICAGQTISIKVKAINMPEIVSISFEGDSSITTFDKLTKRFEWIEPKARKEETLFDSLKEYENIYRKSNGMKNLYTGKSEEEFTYIYVIPYGTKQTLHSWNTLREISKDAFNIDSNKLFSRITKPYEIVFKVAGPTGVSTERIQLDVFERWDTLYNRNLIEYVRINN